MRDLAFAFVATLFVPQWQAPPVACSTLYARCDGAWIAASGGAAWGGITGTLGDQTDLQALLDAKEPAGVAFSELSGAATDAQVPNTITVDLAAAATALAANGGNCAGNNFALGVDASGVGECAQPAFSNLSGAATDAQVPDSITVSLAAAATALAADGADCATSTHFAVGVNASGVAVCEAIADADVPNTITVDLAAAATALAADPADCATSTHFAVGVNASGVATCEAIADADVPDSITVTLAATATALAADPADCSGNNFALGVAASGVAACAQPAFSNLSGAATDAQIPDNITITGAPVTLTSTTLQSDAVIATYTAITGLAFTPAASGKYWMDCFIRYTSTAATTGINFAWDVPAAVTSIHMSGYTTTTALGANEGFSQRADNVGTPTTAAVITVENVAVLSAQLVNGANATSTTLGFTPETANSVSIIAGSVCQVRSYP